MFNYDLWHILLFFTLLHPQIEAGVIVVMIWDPIGL